MNQKNAHLYLPLVQALADGELQCCYNDKWFDWNSPECDFDRPPDRYRRKPEPRVYWLGFDGDGRVSAAFSTETDALTWIRRHNKRTITKFIEYVGSGKNGG